MGFSLYYVIDVTHVHKLHHKIYFIISFPKMFKILMQLLWFPMAIKGEFASLC